MAAPIKINTIFLLEPSTYYASLCSRFNRKADGVPMYAIPSIYSLFIANIYYSQYKIK